MSPRFRALSLGAATAFLFAAGSASAQQRPDFSGQWAAADSGAQPSVAATGNAAFRRGDMGSGWGSPFTITQRADSLIVEFVHFAAYDLQPPLRYAYAMNGAESRNAIMIGHATVEQRGRVSWRGDTLVIMARHVMPASVDARGGTVEVRQALSLASSTLTVVTTRGGVLGGAAHATHTTFARR